MNRLEVWKRLAWKETREDVLAFATVILPFVLFPLADSDLLSRYPTSTSVLIAYWAIGGPMFAVILLAAVKSKPNGAENNPLPGVPVPVLSQWAFSFLMPLAASMLLGAVVGITAADYARYPGSGYPWASACVFGALFAGCYLISAGWSVWGSIAIGAPNAFIGISAVESPGIWLNISFWFIRALVAALVGTALFAIMRARHSRRAGAAALAAAALLMILASMSNIADEYTQWRDYAPWGLYSGLARSVVNPERTLSASCDLWGTETTVTARAFDLTTGPMPNMIAECGIHADVLPVGTFGKRTVYLVQQDRRKKAVRILRWDTEKNKVAAAVEFASARNALMKTAQDSPYQMIPRSVSPDGRWVLLGLRSAVGPGLDYWMCDVENGKSHLVICNTHSCYTAFNWQKHRVVLSISRGPLWEMSTHSGALQPGGYEGYFPTHRLEGPGTGPRFIDLETMHASDYELYAEKEGRK